MQREPIKRFSFDFEVIPAISCMLLMFQAYLVAPLSPTLAKDLSSSFINLAVPAFAIPFAIAAAGMVLLGPSVNLRKCFLISLASLCVGTYFLSMARSGAEFLLIRALTGFGTGAMLPSALLLAIRPSEKRRSFKNIVLIIFALATGMSFGPSIGGWLNGIIGWRCLFRCTEMLAALLFLLYFLHSKQDQDGAKAPIKFRSAAKPGLIWKSRYIYSFVFLTGVFHSGVFVWISYYFTIKYGLDEFHIATDLFIFGLPGFVVTLLMYFYQLDKKVVRILYLALGLTVSGLLFLMTNLPLWMAECVLGTMSVGFGCSQPLFIGILKLPPSRASSLGPMARGAGILFAGYGSGPLLMIALLRIGLGADMIFLILLVLALAYLSRFIWNESKHRIPISQYN